MVISLSRLFKLSMNWSKSGKLIAIMVIAGETPANPVEEREMPESFRLIDVDSDCIIHSVQKPRYVALSYVWGAAKTFRNTKDIRRALEVKGSLLKERRSFRIPSKT